MLRHPEKNEKILKEYWTKLDKIIAIHKKETDENKKTEKQNINWIDWDTLRNKVLKYYAREYKRLNLNKKETLTIKELELLKKFVVAYLYLDFDNITNFDRKILPRRNDYVDLVRYRTISGVKTKYTEKIPVSSKNKKDRNISILGNRVTNGKEYRIKGKKALYNGLFHIYTDTLKVMTGASPNKTSKELIKIKDDSGSHETRYGDQAGNFKRYKK